MELPTIYLAGHPGSQQIVPASKYLWDKYAPQLEKVFINYEGPIHEWGKFYADYFDKVEDEFVIFGLDDFLIGPSSSPLNLDEIGEQEIISIKLCECSPRENEEYPITTQITLWRRLFFISCLKQSTTPWNFETKMSSIVNFMEYGALNWRKYILNIPIMKYNTNSALSKRWQGINWDGVSAEDREYIENNILKGAII